MRPEGPPVQQPLPAIAGGAPEPLGASRCALVVGAGPVRRCDGPFGVYPDPLVDWATNAAESLTTSL